MMPDLKNRWAHGLDGLKARLGMKPIPTEPEAQPNEAGVRERLERQNRRLKHLRQQVKKEEAALAELRAQLVRTRQEASPARLPDEAPIFFLTGRAKSGTSWLMRLLDSHPEILCKGEGRFFGRDYMRENSGQVKLQPRTLYGAIADSEYIRAWIETSVWTRGDDAEEHLTNITGLAVDYFLKRRLSETNKRIVGDKTPFTGVEFVREVAEIYPEARLIHIIRDGRDVAISAIHHIWNHAKHEGGIHELTPEELAKREAYRSDPRAFVERGESIFAESRLAGTAKNWAEMVTRTMDDGPQLLGEKYAEVRYEDLLERPEVEARRLFEFLGAASGERVVKRCVESASFQRRTKGREQGQEESTAFLRKGIAGDWKNVFTERDREVFKQAAGDTLIKLGYEKDYDW